MKYGLALLALVSAANAKQTEVWSGGAQENEGGPADSCTGQKPCVKFTTTLVTQGGVCEGDCYYQICMELDVDMPNCSVDGALSHYCDYGELTDACMPPDFQLGDLPADSDLQAVDHVQCLNVLPGEEATFLLKDGSTCADSATYTNAEDGTNAACFPSPDGYDTCSGNAAGKECIWSVTAPMGCPTDPTTTTTVTTDATTTTTVTTDATTTTTTTTDNKDTSGGGDPHFARWGREHDTFHGECDLVLIHSEAFHNGAGFDMHARTTIQDFFSYIETIAVRIGKDTVQFARTNFYVNGVELGLEDLPFTFGNEEYQYTITEEPVPDNKNSKYHTYYGLQLNNDSKMIFKYYKKFLTFEVSGHHNDFSDAVGLLGEYTTGEMVDRDGNIVQEFQDHAFEWQVNPEDPKIFLDARAPQLPYERCRMPTAARPNRRQLRADKALLEEAKAACAHVSGDNGMNLCINDIMATRDVGLANLW